MIASYAQLLVAEYSRPGDARCAELVAHIVDGTNRMRELLADLLSYSELAGASEQPPEAVDLNAIVEKVRHTLGAQIRQTQADLRVERLPVLRAHEGRMTSLFLNLIGNAMKYRSERAPRIRVTVANGGDHFCFGVADNGIGIAPEYQQRVFTAFKRLHGRDIPGTGIGLAICQRVVEGYGGRIWVESVVGEGSTFRFVLPKSMGQHISQDGDRI